MMLAQILKLAAVTLLCTLCSCEETINLNGQWAAVNANKSIKTTANVPGGIYTDLQHNGIIGDPYFRFNDVEYRWVAKDNWTFSRSFNFPENLLTYKRVFLHCKGLDTVSNISVNGHVVGTSDNMFVWYNFDVKNILQAGSNEIVVSFESPISYAARLYQYHLIHKYVVPPICPVPVQNGECHPNFIRKIQSQFSWDWGPAFPSVGIWKDISIEAVNQALIRDITVKTVKGDNTSFPWEVQVQIFMEHVDGQPESGETSLFLDSKQMLTFNVNLATEEGSRESVVNATFLVPKDMLIQAWWPNGFGKQNLYNLTAYYKALKQVRGQEKSTKTLRIGFRTIELIQEPISNATGLSFYFRVNGIAMFLKGSNWIPADSFPERVTEEYTRILLGSARDAHMNVLRVWGGGAYETEVFYSLADELGILLWHDLMFACSMYPTVDSFLDTVKNEVTQQIRRLQHHASILLWSGNNENEAALVQDWYQTKKNFNIYKNDYLKLYIDTIKPIVESLDSTRPFLSSSPSNGVDTEKEGWIAKDPQSNFFGDVHFYDYLHDSWNWTIYPIPRFTSEYGIQSWTSFETLSKVSIPEDWFYYSKFMTKRQHHLFGNIQMIAGVRSHMKVPTGGETNKTGYNLQTFKALLYLTQIHQAMGIKAESEHYLRHQSLLSNNSGHTMGALYWQLNDIWQSPSWASIEFGGKWKMLQYYAVNFFAPVLVSPLEDNGKVQIFVISDAAQKKSKLLLTMSVFQWKTPKAIFSAAIKVDQPPGMSQKVFESDIPTLLSAANCPGRQYCFLYFNLTNSQDNQILSTNFLLLSTFNEAKGLQKANVQAKVVNNTISSDEYNSEFELQLTTDEVAPFVWLEATGIPGRFSDNGFLLVSSQKTVQFYSRINITAEQLTSQLKVQSLMDVYDSDAVSM